jgi:hypothetical protein
VIVRDDDTDYYFLIGADGATQVVAPSEAASSSSTAGKKFLSDVLPQLLEAGAKVADSAISHGKPTPPLRPIKLPEKLPWVTRHRTALVVGGAGLGVVAALLFAFRRRK